MPHCAHTFHMLLLGFLHAYCIRYNFRPCRYKGDLKTSLAYHFGKLMFVENSDLYFSFGNSIYVNSLCESRQSHEVLQWKNPYPAFKITSAFYIPSKTSSSITSENCIGNQMDIYFVCGVNQIRQYPLPQSNTLYFEELGILCSFWKREMSNKWTLLDKVPFNKQTIHPGLIAASHLASYSNYLYSTNVETGYSLVVANPQHKTTSQLSGPHIYGFGPKCQLYSAYKTTAHEYQYQKQENYFYFTSKQSKSSEKNSFSEGWRSNSYSKLWFGENVQFLLVTNVESKHFYIIFTEQDISAPYTAYEGSLSKIASTITRIGRVCEHDPGLRISASILPNGGGVFTTFRKTRLACRVYSCVHNSKSQRNHCFRNQFNNKQHLQDNKNEQVTSSVKNYLEFSQAVAVSEIVPTVDKSDNVFYALMTTVDSISQTYALCAFNLKSVDQSLDIDHLIRLKQTTKTHSGLSRTVWREENETHSNLFTSKWTVDVVPPSKMTESIMKASKTCPSQPLPDYYSQFATLHPLVGTSVLALNTIETFENQTTNQNDDRNFQQPGQALEIFTLSDVEEKELHESPISLTIQWDNLNTSDSSDIIYIVTNKRTILTVETGVSLKKQISMAEGNLHHANVKTYFIKKSINQKFRIMDRFKIVDNDYSVVSIHKCTTSERLSVNMGSIQHSAFRSKHFVDNVHYKMLNFHPNKNICETYRSCRKCQSFNDHSCELNVTLNSCLLRHSSYSYLNTMDPNLYHFCTDELLTNQPKQNSLSHIINKSYSHSNISSERRIDKMKSFNDELKSIITNQSIPSLINTKLSNQDNQV
ncbi:unnamed protein product [Heterobilharzia americana]|nr:unnamed protein product [Heterobilharzia americana]